jgi:hypothetical protein
MSFPIRLRFVIGCFVLDSALPTEGSNLVPLVTSLRITWLRRLSYWGGGGVEIMYGAPPRKMKIVSESHYGHVRIKC